MILYLSHSGAVLVEVYVILLFVVPLWWGYINVFYATIYQHIHVYVIVKLYFITYVYPAINHFTRQLHM